MKTLFLALLTGAALVTPIYADPIEALAAQIKADYAYVSTHPVAGSERLQHDAEQLKEMQRLQAEVEGEKIATWAYYAQFSGVQPCKGTSNADTRAYYAQFSGIKPWGWKERTPNSMTVDDKGHWTKTYSNENPLP